MDPISQAESGNADFFRVAETKDILQARNSAGDTVLLRAAWCRHLECSKVIFGRCPELVYVTSANGFGSLLAAVWQEETEIVKILVVNAEKKLFRIAYQGDTALHMAIDRKKLDIVKILIEVDPEFDSTPVNKKGETPQLLAVRLAASINDTTDIRVQIKDYIIKKIEEKNAPAKDLDGEPTDHATKGGVYFFRRVESKVAIDSRDKNGNSVLSIAVLNGHYDCSKVILERFPELLYVENTNEKDAPLHHAVWRGISQIVELLVVGADKKLFMMQNISGNTPLHMAVLGRRFEIVKILTKANPDYNQLPVNNKGETPLTMTDDDVTVKIRDWLVGKQTITNNTKEETTPDEGQVLPAAREHELSIPLKYIDLYSRLVKQYGEIAPLKMDELEARQISNALTNFLDMVVEMQVEMPESIITEEKLAKWEHKYFSYAEWGLQINWFLSRIRWYKNMLAKHVKA